jgi:hypothetical protein
MSLLTGCLFKAGNLVRLGTLRVDFFQEHDLIDLDQSIASHTDCMMLHLILEGFRRYGACIM